MFFPITCHMYNLWSEVVFYSLWPTKPFLGHNVHPLMHFRGSIFNCGLPKPLLLLKKRSTNRSRYFVEAILHLSTVEQQQGPLSLDWYVDLVNPCFAILGEQNLELCSWCCLASTSPAALWPGPSGMRNFIPIRYGTIFSQNPGIPVFFGTV